MPLSSDLRAVLHYGMQTSIRCELGTDIRLLDHALGCILVTPAARVMHVLARSWDCSALAAYVNVSGPFLTHI